MMRRRRFLSLHQTKSEHDPAALPKPRGRTITPLERMNQNEKRYAAFLESRRLQFVVSAWFYEAMSWRMADNTFFRPDFLVLLADGTLEVHEVKGRKKGKDGKPDSYWAEEDAVLKLKVCAEQMPVPIVVVFQDLEGNWQERRL